MLGGGCRGKPGGGEEELLQGVQSVSQSVQVGRQCLPEVDSLFVYAKKCCVKNLPIELETYPNNNLMMK